MMINLSPIVCRLALINAERAELIKPEIVSKPTYLYLDPPCGSPLPLGSCGRRARFPPPTVGQCRLRLRQGPHKWATFPARRCSLA